MTHGWTIAASVASITFAACDTGLDQRLGFVDEPRLLAVVSSPSEVVPGSSVTYQALVAGPDGPIDAPPSWAFCRAPKPPTEDNAVAPGCLADEVTDLGTSPTVMAPLPADACLRYGPDTTMPGFRPRDPDATGGYYQPTRATVREDALDLLGFGLTRIKCTLPTAPSSVAQEYVVRYVPNVNPTIDPLLIAGTQTTAVAARSTVTLTATWPVDSVETYLYYDQLAQVLVDRREAMRVSWFTTGGEIAVDASVVNENQEATTVTTTWQTPAPGRAWIWLVLRDSRGGIATQTIAVDVE